MPARLLREGILDSDAVNSLSFEAEVFYRRLMSVVDDFGRFDGRPSVLRSRLYPLRVAKIREADISRWIAECVTAGLLALYESDRKPYILFHKLGQPRAKDSKFPSPPDGICAQMRADENRRAHVRADAPSAGSDSGAGTDTNKDPPNPPLESHPIPAELDTPEFLTAWDEWLADRKARKNPVTPAAAKKQLAKLKPLGPARAINCLSDSIANGWAGLFPEKHQGKTRGPHFQTHDERVMGEIEDAARTP